MRLYKDDLEYILKVLWFLENVNTTDGFFEEFKLNGYEAGFDLRFEWDGGWYVTSGEE